MENNEENLNTPSDTSKQSIDASQQTIEGQKNVSLPGPTIIAPQAQNQTIDNNLQSTTNLISVPQPVISQQSDEYNKLELQKFEQQSKFSSFVKPLVIAVITGILLLLFNILFFNSSQPTTEQRYMELITLPEYMNMSRSVIPIRHTSEILSKTKTRDDVVEVNYKYISSSKAESDLTTALQLAGYKQVSRRMTENDSETPKWTLNYIGSGNQTCNELYVYHSNYPNLNTGDFSLKCVLR